MPKCLNAAGYLFGGQLLAWIDETAGIVAKRHAEMNVVNCCSRQYVFQSRSQSERYHRSHRTAYTCGDVLPWKVRIDTYCEALDGTRTMINRAYFIYGWNR